jgi:hypothetical protein
MKVIAKSNMANRYSPEVCVRAVLMVMVMVMVMEHRGS